jgi:hypothetical protein
MTPQQLETLPCTVKLSDSGLADITFTLPQDQISGFICLLSSLVIMFRNLRWKTKIDIDSIHAREALKTPDRNERLLAFETAVCERYMKYVSNGCDAREAFSCTLSSVQDDFEFAKWDHVRNILTKNKLLKKTGYYKDYRTLQKKRDSL